MKRKCDEFSELEADFTRFTRDIAYCTLTTVDRLGWPRSRLMHPVFEVVDSRPRGWVVTDRTPVQTQHLSANPHVACFFWSPAHNTVSIDCVAAWVDDREVKAYAWGLSPSRRQWAGEK